MNHNGPDDLSFLPTLRVFSIAVLGSLLLSVSFFWLVKPASMGAPKFTQVLFAEGGFWYFLTVGIIMISGTLTLAKRHCGVVETKAPAKGRPNRVRPPRFSLKYRILMTIRNAFIEVVLAVSLIVIGSIQLATYEPWPDSSPIQPVFIHFVAIYWVMIACGVGLIIYAYRTADKD